MVLLKNIFYRWLTLPEKRDIKDIDSPSVTELHKRIIQRKKFLKLLYIDWYREFQKSAKNAPKGLMVELGSGGGFLKTIIPKVVTSDILIVSGIDINFSLLAMPFKDNTISNFFMLDVFHHINNPSEFLKELDRCLRLGGKTILIEPANTLWGRFIWSNFHHEDFNPNAEWNLEKSAPLSSANSALPWIVFFHNAKMLNKNFPKLKINSIRFHTPLRYLISGGLSVKQLLPSFTYNIIKGMEFILSPFNRHIGMFLTIEIEKLP